MTLRIPALSMLMALAALGACGNETVEPAPTEAERQQALRDSAFGAMVEPLERAAEVEQLERDRKRAIDAALEQ
jgi:hypothetical protein